jgi:hypothetical protein
VPGNYARAIRYVHDETVKGINRGLSLQELCRTVWLPSDLSRLPYLKERRGTVAWSVHGVFRQYTGWYWPTLCEGLRSSDWRPPTFGWPGNVYLSAETALPNDHRVSRFKVSANLIPWRTVVCICRPDSPAWTSWVQQITVQAVIGDTAFVSSGTTCVRKLSIEPPFSVYESESR